MDERRVPGKGPEAKAFRWRDQIRWVFAHANGEEFLIVTIEDERRWSSAWTGKDAAEKLVEMGLVEVDEALPDILREHVAKRLRQRREPPSVTMERLKVPAP